MKKPMIGVLPLYDESKESYWMLPGYMKGIEEAGGLPFMLPLATDPETISSIAETFDGFLFTGGHDLNPEIYGEKAEAICGARCEERDIMEQMLFQHVLDKDKPAFGICRGLQLFNALLGGSLYQDLPTQRITGIQIKHKQSPPYTIPAHQVHIEQGNLLYEIVNKDILEVNSYHHQGIKKLSRQLLAAAIAEDGLVEAVVMPEKKFVLGVQWHPEFNYHIDDSSFQLFKAFVTACSE